MTKKHPPLNFEKSIYQIKDKIEELENLSKEMGIDLNTQIESLVEQAEDYKKQIYSNLLPSQRLLITRHPMRPSFLDYISMITTDWIELHGDREGTDDKAILTNELDNVRRRRPFHLAVLPSLTVKVSPWPVTTSGPQI